MTGELSQTEARIIDPKEKETDLVRVSVSGLGPVDVPRTDGRPNRRATVPT